MVTDDFLGRTQFYFIYNIYYISGLPGRVTLSLNFLSNKKTYNLQQEPWNAESKAPGKLELHHTFVEEEELTQKNVVKVLLDKGAKINEKNNDGDTPIHTAAVDGKNWLVQRLFGAGADIYIANNRGLTARDVDRTG